MGWVGSHHATDPMFCFILIFQNSLFFLPRETQETTDNINKYVQTFCISTVYVPSHLCEMFVPSKQYELPAQIAVTQ